jgi:polyphosphate kinase
VFSFENGGDPQLYCASADWMERNFFRRVEIAFPVRRASHRERILRELDIYLRDDSQAWLLDASGKYSPAPERPGERNVRAQEELINTYATGFGTAPIPDYA